MTSCQREHSFLHANKYNSYVLPFSIYLHVLLLYSPSALSSDSLEPSTLFLPPSFLILLPLSPYFPPPYTALYLFSHPFLALLITLLFSTLTSLLYIILPLFYLITHSAFCSYSVFSSSFFISHIFTPIPL